MVSNPKGYLSRSWFSMALLWTCLFVFFAAQGWAWGPNMSLLTVMKIVPSIKGKVLDSTTGEPVPRVSASPMIKGAKLTEADREYMRVRGRDSLKYLGGNRSTTALMR